MIEVTLKCDRCLAAYPAGKDAEALRALAHGDGWSCTPRGRPARDYCPACRKAMMAARLATPPREE